MKVRPGQSILDAGCGTASVLVSALKRFEGVGRCVALDAASKMLDRIEDPRITGCVGDICAMPLPDGLFDVAVCRQVLHYVASINSAFYELKRVLRTHGALVIGQIVPFDDEDADYWFRIVRLRQPVRKHCITVNDLLKAMLDTSFNVARVCEVRGRESLRSWFNRYPPTVAAAQEIRQLFKEAPTSFKETRNIEVVGDDILFENCWTFIRGVKTGE